MPLAAEVKYQMVATQCLRALHMAPWTPLFTVGMFSRWRSSSARSGAAYPNDFTKSSARR